MKKFIIMITVSLAVCSATFAYSYNEKTHEVNECKSCKEGYVSENCRNAHRSYEKWVGSRIKEATVSRMETIADYGKKVAESEEAKKVKDAARQVKDEAFKFLGDKLGK